VSDDYTVKTGVYSYAAGSGGTKYAVYGVADGEGTNRAGYFLATGSGQKYAVHGVAQGEGTNWAGYFEGNGYFSGKLSVGPALAGVERLEVQGNIKSSGTVRATNGYTVGAADSGVKIRYGSGATNQYGNATVQFSGFSSTPVFIVSCSQTDANHTVNGYAAGLGGGHVASWNNANVKTGPIAFNWIAIGQ
jgi:hypothetical protein